MHQNFDRIRFTKIVSKEAIFKYYEPKRVEGYCKVCPNYNKLWSCPPLDITAVSYLEPYDFVLLVCEKITKQDKDESETPIDTYFQKSRRLLGDELIALSESPEFEVLIAGNCYLCDECLRKVGKSCRHETQMKYSLESIGFLVGDIAKELIGIELEWPEPGAEAKSLMTVGAIFAKEDTLFKVLSKEWGEQQ